MTEQELMLTHIRNCRRVDLYADLRPLDPDEQAKYEEIWNKRQAGAPLQYLLGEAEFMGLKFEVNPDVLVPRPETELLVELAIKELLSRAQPDRSLRILDLGTGSGNIAISLAKFIPGAEITAVDCSAEALKVAKRNAALNGVAERIKFIQGDMIGLLSLRAERSSAKQSLNEIASSPSSTAPRNHESAFDLIISNPPYIPSSRISRLPVDVQQEPHLALDGGEDGLKFYRHIIAQAGAYLADGGLLMMEIGEDQRSALESMLQNHSRFLFSEILQDYAGKDRILVAYHGPANPIISNQGDR